MFFGQNGKELMEQWAAFRPAWLHHCFQVCLNQSGLKTKAWKKLVKSINAKKSWTEDEEAVHEEAKEYKAMYLLGQRCLANWTRHNQVTTPVAPSISLDDNTRRTLCWELCERNFRFELLQLDSALDQTSPDRKSTQLSEGELENARALHRLERLALYGRCFSQPSQEITDGSQELGTAAGQWKQRFKYLRSLWALMDSWPGEKPASWRDNAKDQLKNAAPKLRVEWEKGIALFYAQSFFSHFGRAPVLPRMPRGAFEDILGTGDAHVWSVKYVITSFYSCFLAKC